MNLAYFRRSKFSRDETIERLKSLAPKSELKVLSEVNLPQVKGVLLNVCSDSWVDSILKEDKNLIGLMPCGILVLEKDGVISVGSGNPTILGGVTRNVDIHSLAAGAEEKLRKLIDDVTESGELKPTKVKLYSTTTCPYCVMEKQWLDSNKIEHEVIYVDRDEKAAEEMVKNTGQMGVPVTEVGFEDGDSEYIVGFDKRRLSAILKVN